MGYVVMVHVPGTPEDDAELNQVLDYIETGSIKTVGIYYIPNTGEPTCSSCDNVKGKKNGFSRHAEFGYDIHECGKPTPLWRRMVGRRLVRALGYNLLEDEETPVIFRDPNQQLRLIRNR